MGAAGLREVEGGRRVDLVRDGHSIAVDTHGLTVEFDERSLTDDIETLELMAEVDAGNVLKTPALMRRVLGDEQYEAVKAALAEGGRTSVTAMAEVLGDIYVALGQTANN